MNRPDHVARTSASGFSHNARRFSTEAELRLLHKPLVTLYSQMYLIWLAFHVLRWWCRSAALSILMPMNVRLRPGLCNFWTLPYLRSQQNQRYCLITSIQNRYLLNINRYCRTSSHWATSSYRKRRIRHRDWLTTFRLCLQSGVSPQLVVQRVLSEQHTADYHYYISNPGQT
jgi:hypothetical protein